MIELTDKTFKPAMCGFLIVLFYTDWCPICKYMSVKVALFEKEHGTACAKLDLMKNFQALNEVVPDGIPLMVLYKDGEPILRAKGRVDLNQVFGPFVG